jgi:small subunit ribosomal protein S18
VYWSPTDANDILNLLGDIKTSEGVRPAQPGSLAPTQIARDLGFNRPSQTREMIESERREQFQRQIYRKWQPGDVYSPHDLTGAEQRKWKFGRKKPQQDAFDVLGINPLNEYKVRVLKTHARIGDWRCQNFTIMSEYMTETGRIKHSKDTGLRPKNQRKIAKAIRRAIGLGLMPSVHRHPLVVKGSPASRFL